MKVKVLIPFRDKHTSTVYQAGDVVEMTATRYNEIVKKAKFVEPVDDEPATAKEKKTTK